MAYFIADGTRAAGDWSRRGRRGVRVRVIVPEAKATCRLVQWATRHFYEYLLKRGIRIYERHDRMLHSKAMVIDGRWSVIGSCNLDARSLRINLEFFAVIPLQAVGGRCWPRSAAKKCRRATAWTPRRAASDPAGSAGSIALAWSMRKWL